MSVEVTDSLQFAFGDGSPHPEGSQFLSELLVELDGLVVGVFKLLLRLAVGGPVAVLHGGLGVLHAWAVILQRLLKLGALAAALRGGTVLVLALVRTTAIRVAVALAAITGFSAVLPALFCPSPL